MKKKIYGCLLCMLLSLSLVGCGTKYQEEKDVNLEESYCGGYFTRITKWSDSDGVYNIVYANDTKVKYLIAISSYRSGITPLYNADGTLQIYEETPENVNTLETSTETKNTTDEVEELKAKIAQLENELAMYETITPKDCYMCGGKVEVRGSKGFGGKNLFMIYCPGCNLQTGLYESQKELEKYWNNKQ